MGTSNEVFKDLKCLKRAEPKDTSLLQELKGSKQVILTFYATWSQPSLFFLKILDETLREISCKIPAYAIDHSHQEIIKLPGELSYQNTVIAIPTTLYIHNGRVIKELVGYVDKPEVKGFLEELLR